MSPAPLVDRALGGLDDARRVALALSGRLGLLRTIIARRDVRIGTQASLGALTTFALTLLVPGVLLAVGPLVFGVPHVAGDVRYLVLRRRLPIALLVGVATACALILALRTVEIFAPGLEALATIEAGVGWGAALGAAVFGAALARSGVRLVAVGAPLAFLLVEALARPELARLVFAYAHNLVAIGAWVILYRRRRWAAAPALAIVATVTALFLRGDLLRAVWFGGPLVEPLVDEILAVVPRTIDHRTALGLGFSFVFLQAVHYSVWLSWVPQEDLPGEGTTTFRMSFASLVRDFGRTALTLIALSALAVIALGVVWPAKTRFLYLSVATFHAYLEVIMLSFFLASGRLPRSTETIGHATQTAGSRRRS